MKIKIKTVHTSRTIMFAEFEKVMDYTAEDNNFFEALKDNVIGKKSNSGIEKTTNYLRQLYGFNMDDAAFKAIRYFWSMVETSEKSLLAFILATRNDELLSESTPVVSKTEIGTKATIESFEQNIESFHPARYSPKTRKSLAQNIASSWKQAGFIEGKVKNIRVEPKVSPKIAGFAFLLAYLDGARGAFIWSHRCVKALCTSEQILRELAKECAKMDLIQYQHAGNVTTISFNSLILKIGIDGI